jgi:hypothetical protein
MKYIQLVELIFKFQFNDHLASLWNVSRMEWRFSKCIWEATKDIGKGGGSFERVIKT